jgi:CubicO group peptidase (beta-lactamase class C family)
VIDPSFQTLLDNVIHTALAANHVPGIAALIQIDGNVVAKSAAGVRRITEPTPIEQSDLWHLGSCTKAMTATLIARLVERGVMSFDAPLEAVLPELAPRMDAQMKEATIAHLLSHTCGLPSVTVDPAEYAEFLNVLNGHANPSDTGKPSRGSVDRFHAKMFARRGVDVVGERWSIATHYLSRPPASRPGVRFDYSNVGYVVAAALAEKRTGQSWEELLRNEVFAPLGITTAGFGPPGEAGALPADQPRAHTDYVNFYSGRDALDELDKKAVLVTREPDDPEADNLPAMGPAGTAHMSLADWAKFAQDQLDGQLGQGTLLKADTYQRIHRPGLNDYAFGWLAGTDGQRPVGLLAHGGSNGGWCVEVQIVPGRKAIILAATNAGSPKVCEGIHQMANNVRAIVRTILTGEPA